MKKLPYGISNYDELVEGNFFKFYSKVFLSKIYAIKLYF